MKKYDKWHINRLTIVELNRQMSQKGSVDVKNQIIRFNNNVQSRINDMPTLICPEPFLANHLLLPDHSTLNSSLTSTMDIYKFIVQVTILFDVPATL